MSKDTNIVYLSLRDNVNLEDSPKLIRAVTAGSLQRIARSLEKMQGPYDIVLRQLADITLVAQNLRKEIITLRLGRDQLELRRQINILRKRLEDAGLNEDPNTHATTGKSLDITK